MSDLTEGCAPEGCTCSGHRVPGVHHVVACCDTPHIDSFTVECDEPDNCDIAAHNHDITGPEREAIGYFEEVTETPTGIVASGGWCAPSEAVYNLVYGGAVSAPDIEPDPLPEVDSPINYTEWVVEPDDSDWDEPERRYTSLHAAREEFDRRVARARPYEAITLVQRHVIRSVVDSSHGTYVPPPPDPDTTQRVVQGLAAMFPMMPVPRGGIRFERFFQERGTP